MRGFRVYGGNEKSEALQNPVDSTVSCFQALGIQVQAGLFPSAVLYEIQLVVPEVVGQLHLLSGC